MVPVPRRQASRRVAQPSGRRLNRTATVRMHSCRRCTGCEGARDRREQEARRCVALRERIEETLHALVESLPLEKLMLLRPETAGREGELIAADGGSNEARERRGMIEERLVSDGGDREDAHVRSPYDEFSPSSPGETRSSTSAAREHAGGGAVTPGADPPTPMYRPFALS